jgi:hypothetical protein
VNVPTKLRAALALLVAAAMLPLLAACSGGGSPSFPAVIRIEDAPFVPQLVSSELVAGPNRFAFGILTRDNVPIVDAKVHLVFYDLNGGQTVKKFETDAASRVPARDAGLSEQVEHIHADGSRHIHVNVGEQVGIYTAQVSFDRAGDWGVEIRVVSASPKLDDTLRPRFNVLEKGITPAIGSPAPRSRNLTLNDVTDLSQIDSSAQPSPEMHTTRIADAIAAGKPALVLFAVPGYCSSRLCGPELEIMRRLYPQYRDRVEFIHVEFYKNPASSNREPVDAVREWGLLTEPWFFLIDSKGLIAAKFEGPTSLQELDEALKALATRG